MLEKRNLTEGPIHKHLISMGLPMVWGIFAVYLINLSDTYFVGLLGPEELAAMGFCFPVINTLASLSIGLGVGATSVLSRALGSGDMGRVRRLATDGLFLSVTIVCLFLTIGLLTMDPLFRAIGADGRVLELIKEYMSVWYFGMGVLVVPMVGNGLIRANGNSVFPSIIMTVAAIINLVLDPLFIFGWGLFPSLGLQGAAWATLVSRAITLIASLWVLTAKMNLLTAQTPRFKQLLVSWKQLLYISIPAAGTQVIVPVSMGIVTALVATFGDDAVAGFGVASRIEAFSLIGLMGLSSALGPVVGQNWGANKKDRVREGLVWSFKVVIAMGAGSSVLLYSIRYWVASVFSDHPGVIEAAADYLMLVPLSYMFFGLIQISNSTFNAIGRPLPGVVVSLCRMLVFYIGPAYILSAHFGLRGVFFAAMFSNVAAAAVGVYLIRRMVLRPMTV